MARRSVYRKYDSEGNVVDEVQYQEGTKEYEDAKNTRESNDGIIRGDFVAGTRNMTDEAKTIRDTWDETPTISINDNGRFQLTGTDSFLKSEEANQIRSVLKDMEGKTYNKEDLNKQIEAWNATFKKMAEEYINVVNAMNSANESLSYSAQNAEHHWFTFQDMLKIATSTNIGKRPDAKTTKDKIFVGYDYDKDGNLVERWVEAKDFYNEFNSMDDDKKRGAYRDLIVQANNGDEVAYSKLAYLQGGSTSGPANVEYDPTGDFWNTLYHNTLTGLADAADFVTNYVPPFNLYRLTGRVRRAAEQQDVNEFFKDDDISTMINNYKEVLTWQNAYFSELTPGSTSLAAGIGTVAGNTLGMAYSIWAGGVGNSATAAMIQPAIARASMALKLTAGKYVDFVSFSKSTVGAGQAATGGAVLGAGASSSVSLPAALVSKFPNFSAALADKMTTLMQYAGTGGGEIVGAIPKGPIASRLGAARIYTTSSATMGGVLSTGDKVMTMTTNTVTAGGKTISGAPVIKTLSGNALKNQRMIARGIDTARRLVPLAGESALRNTDQYFKKLNAGEEVGDLSDYVIEHTANDVIWGGAFIGAGALINKIRGVSMATKISPAATAEGNFEDIGSQNRWYTPGDAHFTYDNGSRALGMGKIKVEKDLQDLVSTVVTVNGESIFVSPNYTYVPTGYEGTTTDFTTTRGGKVQAGDLTIDTTPETRVGGDTIVRPTSVETAPIPNTLATDSGRAFGAVSSNAITKLEIEPSAGGSADLVRTETNISNGTKVITKQHFDSIKEATDAAKKEAVPQTTPRTIANSDLLKDAKVAPLVVNGNPPLTMPNGVTQVRVDAGTVYRAPDETVDMLATIAQNEGWHESNIERLYNEYNQYVEEAKAAQDNAIHMTDAPALPREMYGTDIEAILRLAAWAKAKGYNLIPFTKPATTISERRYKKFSNYDLFISKLADKYNLPELDAAAIIRNSRGEQNDEYYGTSPNGTLQYALSAQAPEINTKNIEAFMTPEQVATIDIYGALSIILDGDIYNYLQLTNTIEQNRKATLHEAGSKAVRDASSYRGNQINHWLWGTSKKEMLEMADRFAEKIDKVDGLWPDDARREKAVELARTTLRDAIEKGYDYFVDLSAPADETLVPEFAQKAFDVNEGMAKAVANGTPLTSDIVVPVTRVGDNIVYSELDKYEERGDDKIIAHIPAGTKVAKKESYDSISGQSKRTPNGGRFFDWMFDTTPGIVEKGGELYVNKPGGSQHTPDKFEYNLSDYGVYDRMHTEGMTAAANDLLEVNEEISELNSRQRDRKADNKRSRTIYEVTEPGGPVNRINHLLRQQAVVGTIPEDSVAQRAKLAHELIDRAIQEGNGYDEYGWWSTEPSYMWSERVEELINSLESVLLGNGARGNRATLDQGSNIVLEGSKLSERLRKRAEAIRVKEYIAAADESGKRMPDGWIEKALETRGLTEDDIAPQPDNIKVIDEYIADVRKIFDELVKYQMDYEAPPANWEVGMAQDELVEKLHDMVDDLVLAYNDKSVFRDGGYSVYMEPLLNGAGEAGSHKVKANMLWDIRGITEGGNNVNSDEGIKVKVQSLKPGDHVVYPSMDFGSFNLGTPYRYARGGDYDAHQYYILTGSPKGTGVFFYGDPENFGEHGNDRHIHTQDGGAIVHPMNMGATIVSVRELGPNATLIIQIRDDANGKPYSGQFDSDNGMVYKASDEKEAKINSIYDKIARETGTDLRKLAFDITKDDFGAARMLNETPGATREGSLRDYNREWNGKETAIVLMTPENYMWLCKNYQGSADWFREKLERDPETPQYTKDMANGDRFPMPAFEFGRNGSFGQEGRHRALAAVANNVGLIPVAVSYPAGKDYNELIRNLGEKDITEDIAKIITIKSEKDASSRIRIRDEDEVVVEEFDNKFVVTEYGVPIETFPNKEEALKFADNMGERSVYELTPDADTLERPPVTTDDIEPGLLDAGEPLKRLSAGGHPEEAVQRFNELMLSLPTLESPEDYTRGVIDVVQQVRAIYNQVAMNVDIASIYENYGRAIAEDVEPTALGYEMESLRPLLQVFDALGHYYDPSGKSLTQDFYLPTAPKPNKKISILDAILGKDGLVDEAHPVDGGLDDILLDPLRVGDSGFWQKRTGDLFRDADGNFTMDKSGTLEEATIAYTVSALTRGKNKLKVAAQNEVARSKFDPNRSQITSKQAHSMLKDADTLRTKTKAIQASTVKDAEAIADLKNDYSGEESAIDEAIKAKNYSNELDYTRTLNTIGQKGGFNQTLQMNPIQGSAARFGANSNNFRGIANIRRKLSRINVTGTMYVERPGAGKVNIGFGIEPTQPNLNIYGDFKSEKAVNLGDVVVMNYDSDIVATMLYERIRDRLIQWTGADGWPLKDVLEDFVLKNFPLVDNFEWYTAQAMKIIGQVYNKYGNVEEEFRKALCPELSAWIRRGTLQTFNNAIKMSNISNLDNRTISALDEAAAYMTVGTPVKRTAIADFTQWLATVSKLGLNFSPALGNALSEPLRILEQYGTEIFFQAWGDVLNPTKRAEARRILKDLPSRFDGNDEMVGMAKKVKSAIGNIKDKATDASLFPTTGSESFKNLLFFFAAKRNAELMHPGDEQAQNDSIVREMNDTAIAGGKGTTPGIATGDLGRTLNTFKTFTWRNIDDFIERVEQASRGEGGSYKWKKAYEKHNSGRKDKAGRNKFDPRIAARLIGGRIMRSYLFWLFIGAYFGKDFIDALGGDPTGATDSQDRGIYDNPDTDSEEGMTFVDEVINKFPAGPIFSVLQDYWFALRRRGIENGGKFIGWDVDKDQKFMSSMDKNLPLGVAKNRFADMLNLLDRGYSFSGTGRKTYAAPTNALDVIRGFAFGKATTANSMAYGKYRYGTVDVWGDLTSGDWMDFAMNASLGSIGLGQAKFDTTRKDYTGVFNGSWNDIATMQLIIQQFRERRKGIIDDYNSDDPAKGGRRAYTGSFAELTDEEKLAKAKEIREGKIKDFTADVVRAVDAFQKAGNTLNDNQITNLMYLFDFYEGEEDDEWNSTAARRRYVEAGLPDFNAGEVKRTEKTVDGEKKEVTENLLDRSLLIKNAQQGFYGSPKEAANAVKGILKDFKSTYDSYNKRVKDLSDKYYAARNKNKKSAETKKLSEDIEKLQNEYLDKLYARLTPVIEKYGTALIGTYDVADVLQDYMGNMIPYSSLNRYGMTYNSGNDTVYGQLAEWVQKRWGRNSPTSPSDKEVISGIEEAKRLINQGKVSAGRSKAREILERIGRGSLGARTAEVEELRRLAYE